MLLLLLLLLLGCTLRVRVELGEVGRRLLGLWLLCICGLVARAKLGGLGLISTVLLLGRLLLLRHARVCAADLSGELLTERARRLKPWAARDLLGLLRHAVALLTVSCAGPPCLLCRYLWLLVTPAAIHLALVPCWVLCEGRGGLLLHPLCVLPR